MSVQSTSLVSSQYTDHFGECKQNWKYCFSFSLGLALNPLKYVAISLNSLGKFLGFVESFVNFSSLFQLIIQDSLSIEKMYVVRVISIFRNLDAGESSDSSFCSLSFGLSSISSNFSVSRDAPNLNLVNVGGTSLSASFLFL